MSITKEKVKKEFLIQLRTTSGFAKMPYTVESLGDDFLLKGKLDADEKALVKKYEGKWMAGKRGYVMTNDSFEKMRAELSDEDDLNSEADADPVDIPGVDSDEEESDVEDDSDEESENGQNSPPVTGTSSLRPVSRTPMPSTPLNVQPRQVNSVIQLQEVLNFIRNLDSLPGNQVRTIVMTLMGELGTLVIDGVASRGLQDF